MSKSRERFTTLPLYEALHEEHGLSPAGVGWTSQERQARRFNALTDGISHVKTMLDVGCGYGHLAHWMRAHWQEFKDFKYLGIDVHEEAIHLAQEHAFPNTRFITADVRDILERFDFVTASGLLSGYGWDDMIELVLKMWSLTERVFSFNLVDAYTADTTFGPVSIAAYWIKHLGPVHWQIRHNYLEDDTTLVMWKEDPYGR